MRSPVTKCWRGDAL